MDVFISYARADLAIAEPIRLRLADMGLSIFFDIEGGVEAGEIFPQRIGNAVIEAKAVLALWTPHALTRRWCRTECYIAREHGNLVPAAMAPLTVADLREFIDVSYEDLTDFAGQAQHFGWSQIITSIARRLDDWVERNNESNEVIATLDKVASLRKAALAARPATVAASIKGLTGAAAMWERLKTSEDPEDIRRFAESFPNTAEAFEARRRADLLRAELDAFRALDWSTSNAMRLFLEEWPAHHKRAEIEERYAEKLAQEASEKLAKQKKQEDVAFASVNWYDSKDIEAFLAGWPEHPREHEARSRLANQLAREQDAAFAVVNWDDESSISEFILRHQKHPRIEIALKRLVAVREKLHAEGVAKLAAEEASAFDAINWDDARSIASFLKRWPERADRSVIEERFALQAAKEAADNEKKLKAEAESKRADAERRARLGEWTEAKRLFDVSLQRRVVFVFLCSVVLYLCVPWTGGVDFLKFWQGVMFGGISAFGTFHLARRDLAGFVLLLPLFMVLRFYVEGKPVAGSIIAVSLVIAVVVSWPREPKRPT